jgi:hypothetical protein
LFHRHNGAHPQTRYSAPFGWFRPGSDRPWSQDGHKREEVRLHLDRHMCFNAPSLGAGPDGVRYLGAVRRISIPAPYAWRPLIAASPGGTRQHDDTPIPRSTFRELL